MKKNDWIVLRIIAVVVCAMPCVFANLTKTATSKPKIKEEYGYSSVNDFNKKQKEKWARRSAKAEKEKREAQERAKRKNGEQQVGFESVQENSTDHHPMAMEERGADQIELHALRAELTQLKKNKTVRSDKLSEKSAERDALAARAVHDRQEQKRLAGMKLQEQEYQKKLVAQQQQMQRQEEAQRKELLALGKKIEEQKKHEAEKIAKAQAQRDRLIAT